MPGAARPGVAAAGAGTPTVPIPRMAVTIVAIQLPRHANIELSALLLAGAVTLRALGDGPLSIGIRFKKAS